MTRAAALLALLLASCAPRVPDPSPADRATVGPRVPPPAGWVDFCRRAPGDPGCP